MKSISTINSAITKNTECTIVKVRTPIIDVQREQMRVWWNHDTSIGAAAVGKKARIRTKRR